jgi:hypothetical protein
MKNIRSIAVVVEDELSATVMRKLINYSDRNFLIQSMFNMRGNGEIKKSITRFKNASKALPHIVLTDLDREACPVKLLNDWNATNLPQTLLFRIAIRQVESWLLADAKGISDFLSIPIKKIPNNPEVLPDSKRTLINLARTSRKKRLVEELVPAQGAISSVGRLYNERMGIFVDQIWDIERARLSARSLNKAAERINNFCL